ncbi:MAG TPA: transcription antitermination factor NusB [Vicinamibacterales bacterium]|jgi:N utilization substance protein B|nr:transcription antitermination factor NusB [Vicinamibacterales bacterium]
MTRSRTRHRAREAAVQMLYQREIAQSDIEDVLVTFWAANLPGAESAGEDVRGFAGDLVRYTVANLDKIDPLIADTAEHWRPSRMAALDRLILRLAIGEFLHGETPRNVVINEALELAKTFSGDDSAKFINGILDAVKKKLG